MKNKQIVRLTESDIMSMICNTVNAVLMNEDWRKSYDDWADGKGGPEADKKWGEEIKKEHPNADDRRKAFNQHSKSRDKAAGKTKDKKYWRDYDKDMNESIKRAVTESINNLINESLNEIGDTPVGQYQLGRLAQRNKKVYGSEHDVPQYALGKIEKENDPTPKKNMAMGYAAGMQDQIDFMNAVDDVSSYGQTDVRRAANKIGLNYDHYKSKNPNAVRRKYSLNNGMVPQKQ